MDGYNTDRRSKANKVEKSILDAFPMYLSFEGGEESKCEWKPSRALIQERNF